jgi:hypothetical protein
MRKGLSVLVAILATLLLNACGDATNTPTPAITSVEKTVPAVTTTASRVSTTAPVAVDTTTAPTRTTAVSRKPVNILGEGQVNEVVSITLTGAGSFEKTIRLAIDVKHPYAELEVTVPQSGTYYYDATSQTEFSNRATKYGKGEGSFHASEGTKLALVGDFDNPSSNVAIGLKDADKVATAVATTAPARTATTAPSRPVTTAPARPATTAPARCLTTAASARSVTTAAPAVSSGSYRLGQSLSNGDYTITINKAVKTRAFENETFYQAGPGEIHLALYFTFLNNGSNGGEVCVNKAAALEIFDEQNRRLPLYSSILGPKPALEEDVATSKGESVSGWVAVTVPTTARAYTFKYYRLEYVWNNERSIFSPIRKELLFNFTMNANEASAG